MISIFLREQKRYNQESIVELLKCTEEKAIKILKKLKEFGILKLVKNSKDQNELSDLMDIEIENVEIRSNEYLYVFTYVGIIIIGNRILKIYPKYILKKNNLKKQLKKIIKVIEKYNSKEQVIRMYSETNGNNTFNLLSIILFLMNDYHEYGLYMNTKDMVEYDGSGEILWDKTINEVSALFFHNRPFYTKLFTKKRINDNFDYFKRLHECVLTKCSKELRDTDLSDLFDITEVNLTDENLPNFGDREYILEQIERELHVQFNTRKQILLKALYTYISYGSSLSSEDNFSMYGTNNFNLIWEKVCGEVLDNQLQSPLRLLKLPVELNSKYSKEETLISIIEKPIWNTEEIDGISHSRIAKQTLIPDIISIFEDNDSYQFIIFDAKYYNLVLDAENLKEQPGIESVTKQYLYQLAYRTFTNEHNIKNIKNCFLMPTEETEIIDKGYVEFKILHELGLENIKNRLLPADMIYDYYLKNKKMNVRRLNL